MFISDEESNMSGYNVILGRYLADLTRGTECLMVDSKALLSSRLLRFQLVHISAGYLSNFFLSPSLLLDCIDIT